MFGIKKYWPLLAIIDSFLGNQDQDPSLGEKYLARRDNVSSILAPASKLQPAFQGLFAGRGMAHWASAG
ncbi:hypothetical protein A2U01_0027643 [Trifolium medium]|uniref:Uncharacterized protein n=1 Tax=Trifolium medium TaxID=97028 RepID=A0A392P3E8_9FABA|nr:hypothetical protein [Trifolium medium]